MLGNNFFYGTIKKIELAFARMLNDITIIRRDAGGAEVDRYIVPITYAQKESWYVRGLQDPLLERQVDITIPRIGYTFGSISYDGSRKLTTTGVNSYQVDSTHRNHQYNPTPYNVTLFAHILCGSIDESSQIIEQILPYFNPDFTVDIKTMTEMGRTDSVSFILNSVTYDDKLDLKIGEQRMIMWTLQFTAKAYFYGPISSQGVIKEVQIDLHITPSNIDPVDDTTVGKVPRNVRITEVPNPSTAQLGDTYTVTETITEFQDGKIYNPVTDTDVDP